MSDPWDGRLPREWHWLTRAALGLVDTDWLDRNTPGWANDADGGLDDDALRRVAGVISAPAPDSWIPTSVLFAGAGVASSDADQLADWRRLSLGDDQAPPYALMDTTTLYTVYRLLTDDDPRVATPLTIVELAAFLTAYCVYDRICFLQNSYVKAAELNNLFQRDVFSELPTTDTVTEPDIAAICGDIHAPLRSLYKYRAVPWLSDLRAGRFGTIEQRDAWVRSWEIMLERKCDPDWLLRDPDENHSDRYQDHWETPAADLLRDIVDVTGGSGRLRPGLAVVDEGHAAEERSGRVPLAQESNARAVSNLVLADVLGVPYAASVPRLPILRLMVGDARTEVRELLQIPRGARALDEAFDRKAARLLTADRDVIRLPFFPTAILHAAARREDIAAAASEVRDRGAAFRRGLTELNQRLADQDFSAAEDVDRMLTPSASAWGAWMTAGEAGAVTCDVVFLAQEPHISALVLAAALLKSAVATGGFIDLIRRCVRPRYGALGRLAPLAQSGTEIERLWQISDTARFAHRIQALTALDSRE